MEQKLHKYTQGYYTIANRALVQLIPVFNVQYVVVVVAVSQQVEPLVRKKLLNNNGNYGLPYAHYVVAWESEVEKWKLKLVEESQLETLKLLYSSDQSAEGTTVEANDAISRVSDANPGEGANANTKY